jgi:hypothetical protein
VEGLTASAGADVLTVTDSDGSSNAANVLEGLGGNDTLDAQEGVGSGGWWDRDGFLLE